MPYQEDLMKLRKRVIDAVNHGIIDPKLREFYEATLIQIMNEAERQRQHCVAQAEQLRKQAATLDGQASAFSAQSSIVYNVLNSFILQAERAAEEEAERKAAKEQAEAELTDEEKANLASLAASQKETKR